MTKYGKSKYEVYKHINELSHAEKVYAYSLIQKYLHNEADKAYEEYVKYTEEQVPN